MRAVAASASACDAGKSEGSEGSSADERELTARVLSDAYAIKSEVQRCFAQRETLELCLRGPQSGEPPLPVECVGEMGLSDHVWSVQKSVLAQVWCEQKWTDLVTQRLAQQLGANCEEHSASQRLSNIYI